jgi:hypothetical protein
MPKRLEDVLDSRRRINRASQRLNACQDDLWRIQELNTATGYAITSTDLPEQARSIWILTDTMFGLLRDLESQLKQIQELLR